MTNRVQILPDVYLTSVQTDQFKTGCMSINFLRPMRREEVSANALIPSILLRGSENYPDMQAISTRLDTLYGASMGTLNRKKGEVQLIGFFADHIEDELAAEPVFEPLMEFVAEILLHPAVENGCFQKEIVSSEKRNILNAIESRINDKRSYAVSQLLRVMCADEAYGIGRLGERDLVEREDERTLYKHYLDVLAHSQVEIFYMGRKSVQEVTACLQRVLAQLPRGEVASVKTQVVRHAGQVREVVESMDVTQGKLALGFRTDCTVTDEDYPALLMMNAIFGGGITSKLFTKVREELSLCYYAGSSIEKFKGVMVVSSGIEFDRCDTAREEILRQLEACCKGEISEYEFESAKRYILSDLKTAMDSPGRLDDFYIGQVLAGKSGTPAELATQIEAVRPEDVAAAARRVTLDTIYFLKGAEA